MTRLTFKGEYVHSRGTLPDAGDLASDFTMVKTDLTEVSLSSFKEKYKLLNIFPSVDTGTCAMSVLAFNKKAADLGNVAVINLSLDLPFAQKRFCVTEKINNVTVASLFRSDFFKHYPVDIIDGPLKGLCSRVVIIINEKNEIIYTEQIPELVNEPNYTEALIALKS